MTLDKLRRLLQNPTIGTPTNSAKPGQRVRVKVGNKTYSAEALTPILPAKDSVRVSFTEQGKVLVEALNPAREVSRRTERLFKSKPVDVVAKEKLEADILWRGEYTKDVPIPFVNPRWNRVNDFCVPTSDVNATYESLPSCINTPEEVDFPLNITTTIEGNLKTVVIMPGRSVVADKIYKIRVTLVAKSLLRYRYAHICAGIGGSFSSQYGWYQIVTGTTTTYLGWGSGVDIGFGDTFPTPFTKETCPTNEDRTAYLGRFHDSDIIPVPYEPPISSEFTLIDDPSNDGSNWEYLIELSGSDLALGIELTFNLPDAPPASLGTSPTGDIDLIGNSFTHNIEATAVTTYSPLESGEEVRQTYAYYLNLNRKDFIPLLLAEYNYQEPLKALLVKERAKTYVYFKIGEQSATEYYQVRQIVVNKSGTIESDTTWTYPEPIEVSESIWRWIFVGNYLKTPPTGEDFCIENYSNDNYWNKYKKEWYLTDVFTEIFNNEEVYLGDWYELIYNQDTSLDIYQEKRVSEDRTCRRTRSKTLYLKMYQIKIPEESPEFVYKEIIDVSAI